MTLHIHGEEIHLTDILSRSFGRNDDWFCYNYTDLLTLFNQKSPIPNQASWTVFRLTNKVSMKVISVLHMEPLEMGEWLQLPKLGKHVG